ncbi:NAD-binding protein [Mycena albidolilacea]|uniref:NAD-binding protein n=1 Tax=Mycena albidolilacea TaxID=1033008 RepID=A0AAD6ZIW5_9AGAR|nr:NAD-binding protein [Mycena albidolilacea]
MSPRQGVALVTGCAQGIGRSIALRLADDGFDVAVNDISANQTKLEALVDEIRAKGRASSQHVADVSQEEQVKSLFKQAAEHHGGLDVVSLDSAEFIPRLEWDRVMNINARGTFLCYKYAGIQMIKQGRGGRIIGASSPTGTLPGPYCASKFAVRGLTQAAALEFGAHGITVNAYAPGCIDTPLPSLSVTAASVDGDPSGMIKKNIAMSPLKKIGVPEDVSNLVSFLASKESQFITGYCSLAGTHPHLQISVNGGTYFD